MEETKVEETEAEVEQYIPRQYQLEAVDFLFKAGKAVLADEMGVGKTGPAMLVWKRTGLKGPALLIARSNSQSVWIKQAPHWGVPQPTIISGTAAERLKGWYDLDENSFVCCTLDSWRRDLPKLLKVKWAIVFVEEAHRIINRHTSGWKAVRDIKCERLVLITGSPMRRGFKDLWALLYLCDRQRWRSYWRYVQTFGYTMLNEWGAWEILGLRDEPGLQRAIAPYFLRRTMEEVAPEVPKKNRVLDQVLEMTPPQLKLYNQISEEMIGELSDGQLVVAPTVLAKLVRLQQVLVTPKLLDPNGDWGAHLYNIKEMLENTEDHHFVIFTPYAEAIPIIVDFLIEECEFAAADVETLQGGLDALEVNTRSKRFADAKGVCICTIGFAESFDLDTAWWAYFCGFLWDAIANLQAEGRLRRMTTRHPSTLYYPVHEGGIDKDLQMSVLDTKATEMQKVWQVPFALKRLLEKARAELQPRTPKLKSKPKR